MIFTATLSVPLGLRITRGEDGKVVVASVKASGGAREWNGNNTPLIQKGDEIVSLANSTEKENVLTASDVIAFVRAHELKSVTVEFRRAPVAKANTGKESPKAQTYFVQLETPLGLAMNSEHVVTGIDPKGSAAQWNQSAKKRRCREVRMKDRLVAFYQDEERVAVASQSDSEIPHLEALSDGTKVELELVSHASPLWNVLSSAARMSVAAYRQAKDSTAHLLNISYAHDFTPLPAWLLGHCYDYDESLDEQIRIQAFLEDFKRRLWFTYRCGFPRLGAANITSDTGWGCMLRSAQMIMAQGFMYHYLGRDWMCHDAERPSEYYQILRWFLDMPGPRHPYSIHNMLEHAKVLGKPIDSWHGPWAVCVMLQKCLEAQNPPDINFVVCDDGTVYKDHIIRLCSSPSATTSTATNSSTTATGLSENSNAVVFHTQTPSSSLDNSVRNTSTNSAAVTNAECEEVPLSPASLFVPSCTLPLLDSPSISPTFVSITPSALSFASFSSIETPASFSSVRTPVPPLEEIPIATTTAAVAATDIDTSTAVSATASAVSTIASSTDASTAAVITATNATANETLIDPVTLSDSSITSTPAHSSDLHATSANTEEATKVLDENKLTATTDKNDTATATKTLNETDTNEAKEAQAIDSQAHDQKQATNIVAESVPVIERSSLFSSILTSITSLPVFTTAISHPLEKTELKDDSLQTKDVVATNADTVSSSEIASSANAHIKENKQREATQDINSLPSFSDNTSSASSLPSPINISFSTSTAASADATSSSSFPSSTTSSPEWKAVLIFIPLRLGVKSLNPLYVDSLLRLFQFPQTLGIIGGRPSSSLYFIGTQGTRLFYLDPHTTQSFVGEGYSSSLRSSASSASLSSTSTTATSSSPSAPSSPLPTSPSDIPLPSSPSFPPPFPTNSFHCATVQSINIFNLDPSMALAFYCRTRADLEDLFERVQIMNVEAPSGSLPVFATAEVMPAYLYKGASKRGLTRRKSTETLAPESVDGEVSSQRFDEWESELEVSTDEKTMESGSEGDDFVLVDDA